jgi:hypothetical protein
MVARVEAPALATQPFAEQQMGAAELGADASAAEPGDRFAVSRAAASPSLSSARERASTTSAQSVPPARA